MSISIDNHKLFKENLSNGINIFTGAGFSCLPSPTCNVLPTASDLCNELCDIFNLPKTFGDDLESLSSLAPKQQLQDYLRKRFTVYDYNEKYDVINKIKINSFITTNIDNIIHCVMDNSKKYYLRSITYYGATGNAVNELCYIPLHGDVTDQNSNLYFGKFDLATVDKANSDLFDLMHAKLLGKPVLFCGYGFHDSGVLKTVKKLLDHASHDIWVQFLPNDNKSIELFRALGCNIISSDTKQLLQWIDEELRDFENDVKAIADKEELKSFLIPSINQVESIPVAEFYQKGNTHWHAILANHAFELPIVNKLYDLALEYKNVILIGGRFTGKSTALMQLSLKVNAINKLYVDEITKEQAGFIVGKISDVETWIFFHDCSEDIEAYRIFAEKANIKVVGIGDDYRFEISKHLLDGVNFKVIDIDELTEMQAQQLYEYIPNSIKKNPFRYKDTQDEKYSMLEMISKNVKNVYTKERVKNLLLHLNKSDEEAFNAVLLTAYLSDNGSALSMDVVFRYFNATDYECAKGIISKAKSLLRDFLFVKENEMAQDYFRLRSKLFSLYAMNVLRFENTLKESYARAIEKFIYEIPPYIIFRYDVFRRKSYDSSLFYDLFKIHGDNIYSYLYNYDSNPYTLQQWALFRAKCGDYKQAFIYIDKAMSEKPNNFSMKNSRAIILFEANKKQKTSLALEKMKEAMEILRACYTNDKRKVYHAQIFSEFAMYLYDNHSDSKYMDEARKWIVEIMEDETSNSHRTKHIKNELDKRIYKSRMPKL
jgi:hypothetical protein